MELNEIELGEQEKEINQASEETNFIESPQIQR